MRPSIVLTRTMPHHSKAGLLGDPAMQRQQRMLAAEMIEMARVHPQLRTEPAITALEVLSTARGAPDTVGLALQALAFALCGQAIARRRRRVAGTAQSRADFHPARRADTICALARGWTVFERWAAPHREALREEYERMFHYGDEPRRIRVGALVRALPDRGGRLEAAERVVVDCQAASRRRLKLPQPHNDLVALAGRLYLARGRGADAAAHPALRVQPLRAFRATAALCGNTAAAARGGGGGRRRPSFLATARSCRPAVADACQAWALAEAASQVRTYLRLGAVTTHRAVVEDLRALGTAVGRQRVGRRARGRLEGHTPVFEIG